MTNENLLNKSEMLLVIQVFGVLNLQITNIRASHEYIQWNYVFLSGLLCNITSAWKEEINKLHLEKCHLYAKELLTQEQCYQASLT